MLTTVGGRLPEGPPVPLLPPLNELVLTVVQAADASTMLVGRGGMQHGDTGSPPACNGVAMSLRPQLFPASIFASGQGAGLGLTPSYPSLPLHHPWCYGGLEGLTETIQVVPQGEIWVLWRVHPPCPHAA